MPVPERIHGPVTGQMGALFDSGIQSESTIKASAVNPPNRVARYHPVSSACRGDIGRALGGRISV